MSAAPSSLLQEEGPELRYPPPQVPVRLGVVSQVISRRARSFAVPLLLLQPLSSLCCHSATPGQCPGCCLYPCQFSELTVSAPPPGIWNCADCAQPAPETTHLHTAHRSCPPSSWLPLNPLIAVASLPCHSLGKYFLDRTFQKGFLYHSCGASKNKILCSPAPPSQRPQAFWGPAGLHLGGPVRTLAPTRTKVSAPLSHLTTLDRLHLLRRFFSKVQFPFPIAHFFLKMSSPSSGSVMSEA